MERCGRIGLYLPDLTVGDVTGLMACSTEVLSLLGQLQCLQGLVPKAYVTPMKALKTFSLFQTKQKINRKFIVSYEAIVHVLQGPVMKVFEREKNG